MTRAHTVLRYKMTLYCTVSTNAYCLRCNIAFTSLADQLRAERAAVVTSLMCSCFKLSVHSLSVSLVALVLSVHDTAADGQSSTVKLTECHAHIRGVTASHFLLRHTHQCKDAVA
eukprot:19286-Heterococcus_DN1.PRE.3